MSMATGPQQNNSPSQKVSNRSPQKEQKMSEGDQSGGKLLTFTIDASTGQVVKFETLDATGVRHELSDEEKASLAQEGSERLEEALEEAFEAGIDCVLGENGRDETEESEQDAQLRHLLLTPLIKDSPAKRLLQREVLGRAILGTLIQHSMKPPATASAGSAATGLESDRAAATRAN
jgi:hypothetical protein